MPNSKRSTSKVSKVSKMSKSEKTEMMKKHLLKMAPKSPPPSPQLQFAEANGLMCNVARSQREAHDDKFDEHRISVITQNSVVSKVLIANDRERKRIMRDAQDRARIRHESSSPKNLLAPSPSLSSSSSSSSPASVSPASLHPVSGGGGGGGGW